MAAKQDKGQAARQLADSLRNTIDTAQGKVDVGGELTWLDYARGKDVARYLRTRPELLEALARPEGPDRTADDVVSDAMTQLLQRKLLLACERKFKKPKPGRTKLVKWPRTLDGLRDQSWREDAFFAWTYDRPTSAWYYVGSALLVVGVLGATLFPLAPYPVRLAVLYILTGLLAVLLGTIALRYLVFAVVWVASGYHLWLLPNMMSEKLPITEIFTPVVSLDSPEPGKAQYAGRAATLLLLVSAGYALHRTAPDAGAVRNSVREAGTSLFEYLDMMAAKDMLAGNTTANTTGGGGASGQRPGAQAGAQQQRAGADEQQRRRQQQGSGGGEPEQPKSRRRRRQAESEGDSEL